MPCPPTGDASNIIILAIASIISPSSGISLLDYREKNPKGFRAVEGLMKIDTREATINEGVEAIKDQVKSGALVVLLSTLTGLMTKDIHDTDDIFRALSADAMRVEFAKRHNERFGHYPDRSSVELVIGYDKMMVN